MVVNQEGRLAAINLPEESPDCEDVRSEGRSGRYLACFPEAFHLMWGAVLSTDGPFQQTAGYASDIIRPAVYVSHHIGMPVVRNV